MRQLGAHTEADIACRQREQARVRHLQVERVEHRDRFVRVAGVQAGIRRRIGPVERTARAQCIFHSGDAQNAGLVVVDDALRVADFRIPVPRTEETDVGRAFDAGRRTEVIRRGAQRDRFAGKRVRHRGGPAGGVVFVVGRQNIAEFLDAARRRIVDQRTVADAGITLLGGRRIAAEPDVRIGLGRVGQLEGGPRLDAGTFFIRLQRPGLGGVDRAAGIACRGLRCGYGCLAARAGAERGTQALTFFRRVFEIVDTLYVFTVRLIRIVLRRGIRAIRCGIAVLLVEAGADRDVEAVGVQVAEAGR